MLHNDSYFQLLREKKLDSQKKEFKVKKFKLQESSLNAFCKLSDSTDKNDTRDNDDKNRDEPASGSQWSDNDLNISSDEFFTLTINHNLS